jgi:chromosome segregation ATPase
VAQQREAVQARQQQADAAQQRWLQQVHSLSAHWQGTTHALSAGSFNAGQLRDAATGGRALNRDLQRAGQHVSQAQHALAQSHSELGARQEKLRTVSGELRSAQQMLQLARAAARQLEARRQEAEADELAARKWRRTKER